MNFIKQHIGKIILFLLVAVGSFFLWFNWDKVKAFLVPETAPVDNSGQGNNEGGQDNSGGDEQDNTGTGLQFNPEILQIPDTTGNGVLQNVGGLQIDLRPTWRIGYTVGSETIARKIDLKATDEADARRQGLQQAKLLHPQRAIHIVSAQLRR